MEFDRINPPELFKQPFFTRIVTVKGPSRVLRPQAKAIDASLGGTIAIFYRVFHFGRIGIVCRDRYCATSYGGYESTTARAFSEERA